MFYETFRADFISRMAEKSYTTKQICNILTIMDAMSDDYDFSKKKKEIIVVESIPEEVKYFLACKVIKNCKKGTLYNYSNMLKHFFETIKKGINDVTANDIRGYLGLYKQERNVTNSTLASTRNLIDDFFKWCCSERIIDINPCHNVDHIKYSDNLREPMDRDELEIMRSSCKDKREKAVVEVLYSTGCRVSEIAALTMDDVDWQKRTITIQHGKGDVKRTSYLNSKAVLALKNYLKTRCDDCNYLFVNARCKNKHGIQRKSFENLINKIWKRTGLSHKITPHIFRNTTGTLSAQSGMPIQEVQKLLGHKNIKTTMRYVKVLDDNVKVSHGKYLA